MGPSGLERSGDSFGLFIKGFHLRGWIAEEGDISRLPFAFMADHNDSGIVEAFGIGSVEELRDWIDLAISLAGDLISFLVFPFGGSTSFGVDDVEVVGVS